jgi:glycosyltransferase involved in cell wall biosynthesis
MGTPIARARRLLRSRREIDPRIAWLSPMPPARSGIATYSRAVLDGLRRIGFTPGVRALEPIWPVGPRHEGTIPWYALGVYHLGNNVEFHRDIYRHAIQTPGLVVIHDLALDDLVRGMIAAGDPLGHQALREGLANAHRLRSLPEALANEPLQVPFVAHVARRARGIVAHSPFVERYLRALGCRTPVYVAPHPLVEDERDVARAQMKARALRAPLETIGMRTLIGVLGDQNEAKQIDAVLAGVARLPEDVYVALVGRRIEGYELEPVVAASGLGSRARVHADVSDEEFLGWTCAADVVVDLRFPHRGEVSGALARAMQCGRPTVVSATGTYLDLPEDAVVRVPPGRLEPAELAATLSALVGDPERRRRIGEAAREHVDAQARAETTARVYAEAIDGTLALLRDPTRRALARWAGALVDLGVGEEAMREGYGLSYARAVESFRAGSASRP